jgi:hypothetical protein
VQIENDTDITLNGKSGVQILLDGKQTFLSGKELSDLLKSMSSNNLKSIEIINNPSARYDATGAAGIINIKTKKNQTKGLNGNISTAFAYGVSPKQLENLAFNYRVNRINVYGTYNHTLGYYNYLYGTDRQQNGKSYDSHTIDVDKRQKMAAQVGVDYFIDEKNTVGFLQMAILSLEEVSPIPLQPLRHRLPPRLRKRWMPLTIITGRIRNATILT